MPSKCALASDELMPVTVLYFLRQVAAGLWDGAQFHRNAGHVQQASLGPNAQKGVEAAQSRGMRSVSVPIQEYSPSHPHEQYTLGLAGRPGGPDFYFNTVDN
eukprot:719494-Prymnesium_polylepis.2